MTNEEYKQFINEYCRNVGSIKIKCDDCKFVDNCVDYGWQECKKFTPKPSEPMTNQEYIKSLNTEQLAKFIFWQHFDVYGKTLYELMVNASKGVSRDKQAEVMIGAVVEWLKQPHTSLKNDEK